MALWAAARQTSTALDRFVDEAEAATSLLVVCPPEHDLAGDGPEPCFERGRQEDLDAVRSLPGVTAAGRLEFHEVSVEVPGGDDGLPAGLGVASTGAGAATATVAGDPVVVDGRLPSVAAPDEVVAIEPAARSLGVEVGDRVVFRSAMGDPQDEPVPVQSEVVGVIRTATELLPLRLEEVGGPAFHAGPGWVEAHGDDAPGWGAIAVWLDDGDRSGLVERASAVFGDRALLEEPVLPPGELDTIEHATNLESRAGMALAVVAALAAAFFVGQAVSRQARAEASDDDGLSALGMTRWDLAAVPALRWLPVAIGGALLAVVSTWVAAAFGPLGIGRRGPWDRSPSADWTVLAIGFVTTLAIVLAVPVLGGLRRGAGRAAATAAVRPAAVGTPDVRAGIGLAWASLRRGSALPLVSAVLATALALTAIITAAGGAASLRLVTGAPQRFGAPWDALVAGGGGFESPEAAARELAALPGVASAAGIAGDDATIEGEDQVWVQALFPVGDLPVTAPVVVSGRAPSRDREIALGRVTMEDTGAAVGDEVAVEVEGVENPLRFEVVGVAMVTDGFEPNVGDGALVTPEALRQIAPGVVDDREVGIELADGPGREAALDELRRTVRGAIVPFPVPATLANAERIADTPLLLAIGGALLAAATLVHALVTSVRRSRRELAVCQVLGFTRRQVHRAVATQATLLALAAVVVGVPLGVIAARWGWRALARSFGVVSEPLVPVWVVLACAVVVVAVANLAAAPPSRWATRRRPAEALRAE
jgi:hypothetical protein